MSPMGTIPSLNELSIVSPELRSRELTVREWSSQMMNQEGSPTETLDKWLSQLRRSKKLHTIVEDRLIELMSQVAPDYHPVKEPVGQAGGRNDLMLFEFSKKKILFEIFATKSQVSRDLLILHKTHADKKIAIIIDKSIDSKVFETFLRENPEDNYPFLFVGELFQEPLQECLLKLRQLVLGDRFAEFIRMYKATVPRQSFLDLCLKHKIEVFTDEQSRTRSMTFTQVFVTLVLGKCLGFGIKRERVLELGKWLSTEGVVQHALRNSVLGMNVILYTDFANNFALYGCDRASAKDFHEIRAVFTRGVA